MVKFIQKKETRIPFTKEGYEKVLADKEALLKERPLAVENLRKSRELGDLSENGYYKAARARLSSIDANLRKLDRLRKLGVIVTSQKNGNVDIGSTIVVFCEEKEYTYTLVGGYESDPKQGTISYMSPLGKALMGKCEGSVVMMSAPAGVKYYTILKVT
jgi:transcription elongation factor GreA